MGIILLFFCATAKKQLLCNEVCTPENRSTQTAQQGGDKTPCDFRLLYHHIIWNMRCVNTNSNFFMEYIQNNFSIFVLLPLGQD